MSKSPTSLSDALRRRLTWPHGLACEDATLIERVRQLEAFHAETVKDAEEQLLLQDTAIEPEAARGVTGEGWLDRFIISFRHARAPIVRDGGTA